MKQCKYCGASVDMPKGFICRSCTRKRNVDAVARYRATEKGSARTKQFRASETYKESQRASQKRYNISPKGRAKQRRDRIHPHMKARVAIWLAKDSGRIVPQPCEICGNPKSEAHHYRGYDQQFWLDVRWLCRKHHNEAERRAA